LQEEGGSAVPSIGSASLLLFFVVAATALVSHVIAKASARIGIEARHLRERTRRIPRYQLLGRLPWPPVPLEKGSQLPGGRAVVAVGGCGFERAHAAVWRPFQHEKDEVLLFVVVDVLETRTRPGWRFPGVATGVVHRMSALGDEGVEVVAVVGVVGTAGIVGNVGAVALFGVIMIALFGVNFGAVALVGVAGLFGITTVASVTVRAVPPPGYYVLLDCHPRDTDMLAQPYRAAAAETPVPFLRQARLSGEGPEAVVTRASIAVNVPV
jgi:hypothetical protein